MRPLYLVTIILLLCLPFLASPAPARADSPHVSFLRVPDGGIQPQIAVDAANVLHLVYFSGAPGHGDLYYVHTSLTDDKGFSQPIRVNSIPQSAIALGGIRGAQMALGRAGQVYVVWNASLAIKPGRTGSPFYFARLNDARTAFEPQRNLVTWAGGIDGGGSVAADKNGNVYAVWHGGGSEPDGGAILARSIDDGKTFSREVRMDFPPLGQCGCCGMKAFVNAVGDLLVLYRSAAMSIHRDTVLIRSRDHGDTFEQAVVHPWYDDTCPMTGYALADGLNSTLAAWETENQVYYASDIVGRTLPAVAAPGPARRKYPTVAQASDGAVLLAWVESTQADTGKLGWQVYDAEGAPLPESGLIVGVSRYSFPASYIAPDGGFVIVY